MGLLQYCAEEMGQRATGAQVGMGGLINTATGARDAIEGAVENLQGEWPTAIHFERAERHLSCYDRAAPAANRDTLRSHPTLRVRSRLRACRYRRLELFHCPIRGNGPFGPGGSRLIVGKALQDLDAAHGQTPGGDELLYSLWLLKEGQMICDVRRRESGPAPDIGL